MLEHEILAFGRRLGLEALALSREGMAQLDIEGLGTFHLEQLEKGRRRELLIYLTVPVPPVQETEASRRLLEMCSWRHALPMPLHGGVFSGQALVLTRMDEDQVSAAGLENALRFLAGTLYGG